MFGLLTRKTKTEAEWRERRRADRLPVQVAAEIRLPAKKTLPCQTINISTSGAKLVLPRSTILPGTFEVAIPSKKIRRNARLVWRGEDEVGIQFL